MHTARAPLLCHGTAGEAGWIRPARADEAELLTDLSLRSKALWGYDASFIARCRAIMQVKAGNIEVQPHYVAEIDGRVVGFYGFEPEADGIGLDYLFIENELIGHGIGRALWEHAVGTARSLGHSALIVVSDPNAEGFYVRMGCRRVGTRPSDLENGRQLPLLRYDL
jgi:N-acetylglutamate synthase-like GNAT family acetyltransferase